MIARSPVFWILLGGVLLCNLYHTITTTQLGVVLGDSVGSGEAVAVLVSVFAGAVIVGRFVCGIALDRLPPHLVAAVAMALPGVGCLIIATSWDTFTALVVAVCCLGAAWGAEGDVIAYLVARRFSLQIYSTVLSILSAAIGVSSALGALILSRTLQSSPSFNGFLILAGIAAFVGGALFLLLGRGGAWFRNRRRRSRCSGRVRGAHRLAMGASARRLRAHGRARRVEHPAGLLGVAPFGPAVAAMASAAELPV